MILAITIISLLAAALVGLGILLRAVSLAPDGMEDETGFHSAHPFGRDRVVEIDSVPTVEPALKVHHPAA